MPVNPLPPGNNAPAHDPRAVMAAVKQFQAPVPRRSAWQLATTVLAYAATNAAMYLGLGVSAWLTAALAFPAAGLMVRVFIIQHDCGHGSFFRTRRLNDWVGRVCGVITFTPYAFWRRQHNNHHACFNNLDRRHSGADIYSTCATLREYKALPPLRRLGYRVSRHPLVSQFLLPPVVFLLVYRLPFDTPASWTRERASVYLNNLAIAAALAALALVLGVWQTVFVQGSIIGIASIAGVWLFTVQHRFEEAHWARQPDWNAVQASIEGSSYLKLPRVLQWFTGNIGFHHIHHLAARVPNYLLQECHESNAAFREGLTTLTLLDALRAPAYALWDEDTRRMVRFPPRSSRGRLAAAE